MDSSSNILRLKGFISCTSNIKIFQLHVISISVSKPKSEKNDGIQVIGYQSEEDQRVARLDQDVKTKAVYGCMRASINDQMKREHRNDDLGFVYPHRPLLITGTREELEGGWVN